MTAELNRRNFLKGAAFAGATALGGAMLAGCAPRTLSETGSAEGEGGASSRGGVDPSSIEWDKEADVVIVGGGGAGFAAAIEAAEAGASVLVLEKNVVCGGNTSLSGGLMLAAGTPLQEELGGETGDTAEAFAEQMLRWMGGLPDAELVTEMCVRSAEAAEFMTNLGRIYTIIDVLPPIWAYDEGHIEKPVKRALWCNDYDLPTHFGVLQQKFDTFDNAEALTKTEATHLIANEAGEVIGVEAVSGSSTIRCKARKGVILASCSYDDNLEMTKSFSYQQYWALKRKEQGLQHSFCSAVGTNTGDGIRMALEMGAELVNSTACVMPGEQYFGGISEYATAEGHESNEIKSNKCEGTILVNKRGRRFVQEDADWAYVTWREFQEILSTGWVDEVQDSMVYAVCDAAHLWQWENKGIADKPTIVSADTLEELAALIDVPADNFIDEINRWNGYCADKHDPEFDRRMDFGTIEQGPFYADIFKPAPLGTAGGLKQDMECRVIDVFGEPIPRLYCAGMISSGCWNGPFYIGSGWAVLGTVVWGRKAGQGVAALDSWE